MNGGARPARFKNIAALVKASGGVTIGGIGPVSCGATAADEYQSLAMLVRQPEESLEELLDRLDRAIVKAWDEGDYTDEINE
ncbi:MAG: hypothetical protein IPP12_08315 [Nitrospira sp.]|nr:hypothetical protein [Nitrospira sp.]